MYKRHHTIETEKSTNSTYDIIRQFFFRFKITFNTFRTSRYTFVAFPILFAIKQNVCRPAVLCDFNVNFVFHSSFFKVFNVF